MMKFSQAVSGVLIFSGLLSGCAYIEGRKDQQTAVPATTKGHVITVKSPPAPAANTLNPSPSTTASKIIAPLTQ
ncbi:MAG TPA: hypothetical protein VLJ15_03905 [Gammaproteobacteria bacterium]|nr:hypothetical protein [Gammaproteobacteria bacterium]